MKTILMAALIFAGLAVHADGDQESVVIKCRSLQMVPDNNYAVTLSEGGITGHMSLRVENSTFVGLVVRNYFVDEKPMHAIKMGAPKVYVGPKARLTVNFTTTPVQGGHYGTLEEISAEGAKNSVALVCNYLKK